MPRKEPRKIEPIVSFKPDSGFTWIRLRVCEDVPKRPPKTAKKKRRAWT